MPFEEEQFRDIDVFDDPAEAWRESGIVVGEEHPDFMREIRETMIHLRDQHGFDFSTYENYEAFIDPAAAWRRDPVVLSHLALGTAALSMHWGLRPSINTVLKRQFKWESVHERVASGEVHPYKFPHLSYQEFEVIGDVLMSVVRVAHTNDLASQVGGSPTREQLDDWIERADAFGEDSLRHEQARRAAALKLVL